MIKKGDTLVEVSLAIGIFSMVAIAITAVLISSTSGAQTALEATLAREEIDTQAEAIRFVQSSYIANSDNDKKDETDDPLIKLWKTITENAIDLTDNSVDKESVLQYHPMSCGDLFTDNTIKEHAFVLNPRILGGDARAAYVDLSLENNYFQASTYPRLIYSDSDGELVENYNTNLSRVEGIYVIAVKDPKTTGVVDYIDKDKDGYGVQLEDTEAYYDFYIRTCWYGAGASEPSTISTVVRLNDPDAITVMSPSAKTAEVSFDRNNSNGGGSVEPIPVNPGETFALPECSFKWMGEYGDLVRCVGWSTDRNGTGTIYQPGQAFTVPESGNVTLYAVWDTDATLWLDLNTFIDVKNSNTSGREGFYYDIYVNGKKEASDVIDYYREVKVGNNITIMMKGVNGYQLSNYHELCDMIVGCTIRQSGDNYVITLGIVPDSLSADLNSSNVHAINIEPIWVKK